MKIRKISTVLLQITIAVVVLGSCSSPSQENTDDTPKNIRPLKSTIPPLDLSLKAHGGLATWQSYRTLRYDLVKGEKREKHLVDLQNRKVRIETDNYTLGFDGTDVWVTPGKEAYGKGSPRFYHNLYFYFFALPFVLGDPGIIYKDEGLTTVDSSEYQVVRIGYETGIGDASEDNYVLYLAPENHQLSFINYTVTYYSGESSEKYNALRYDKWQKVDGLMVPKQMTSYRWQENSFGEKRGTTTFENVSFSKDAVEQSLFDKPEGAYVEPPKS